MSREAFEKVQAALAEAHEIIIHAKSDAAFDGRSWEALGRMTRERYMKRAAAGYAAVFEVRRAEESKKELAGQKGREQALRLLGDMLWDPQR